MPTKTTDRFFFISYHFGGKQFNGFGSFTLETRDKAFPSFEIITRKAKAYLEMEDNEMLRDGTKYDICPLNIVELSESDYRDLLGV